MRRPAQCKHRAEAWRIGLLDQCFQRIALVRRQFSGRKRDDGWSLNSRCWVTAQLPLVDRPTAKALEGAERSAAGARRTLLLFKVLHIRIERGFGQQCELERCPAGASRQPGDKVTQGAKVGRNRFGIFAGERLRKGAQWLWIGRAKQRIRGRSGLPTWQANDSWTSFAGQLSDRAYHTTASHGVVLR